MDTDSHVDACPGLKGHFAVCAARGLNLTAKVCCINGPAGAASSSTRASQPPWLSPGRRLRCGLGGHGQLLLVSRSRAPSRQRCWGLGVQRRPLGVISFLDVLLRGLELTPRGAQPGEGDFMAGDSLQVANPH